MTLEALEQAAKRTVGVKQTEKAVLRKQAVVVFIGSDADERVVYNLMQMCREGNIPVVTATMQEIGRACKINVRAGAAAIVNDKGLA